MTTIINLTPHALHIRRADGSDIVIEPSGIVPRLEVSRAECAPVLCEDGVEIAVSRATFGALTGMPETSLKCSFCGTVTVRSHFYKPFDFEHDPKWACPKCGLGKTGHDWEQVSFVVSALCAQSPELAGRNDVYAPGESLRDTSGKIIGATGLSRINPLAGAR